MSNSLKEYKDFVVAYLREFESSRIASDPEKMRKLSQVSDDTLLKKWLWIASIVGGIVSFGILLPLGTFILAPFVTSFIMEPLWMLIKFAMGLSLITFFLAIYMTVKRS